MINEERMHYTTLYVKVRKTYVYNCIATNRTFAYEWLRTYECKEKCNVNECEEKCKQILPTMRVFGMGLDYGKLKYLKSCFKCVSFHFM